MTAGACSTHHVCLLDVNASAPSLHGGQTSPYTFSPRKVATSPNSVLTILSGLVLFVFFETYGVHVRPECSFSVVPSFVYGAA